ncbi:MAG: XkdX family protein [Lachnospiraceae bacterium]|nr:XkdX family protein [Lachnospiraceae bacterium]
MSRRDKVGKYYAAGLWTLGMVRNAVGRWITEAEFTEITGQTYK